MVDPAICLPYQLGKKNKKAPRRQGFDPESAH